jgi:hypothetical protein
LVLSVVAGLALAAGCAKPPAGYNEEGDQKVTIPSWSAEQAIDRAKAALDEAQSDLRAGKMQDAAGRLTEVVGPAGLAMRKDMPYQPLWESIGNAGTAIDAAKKMAELKNAAGVESNAKTIVAELNNMGQQINELSILTNGAPEAEAALRQAQDQLQKRDFEALRKTMGAIGRPMTPMKLKDPLDQFRTQYLQAKAPLQRLAATAPARSQDRTVAAEHLAAAQAALAKFTVVLALERAKMQVGRARQQVAGNNAVQAKKDLEGAVERLQAAEAAAPAPTKASVSAILAAAKSAAAGTPDAKQLFGLWQRLESLIDQI